MSFENISVSTVSNDSWTSAPNKKKSKYNRKKTETTPVVMNKSLMNPSHISPTSVATEIGMTYENPVYYRLSEFQNEGGCLRCVTKTCNITGKHGLTFPDEFAFYVKNPTKIGFVAEAIFNARLDFNKKTPLYAICNYNNRKCKNCEEGRIRYVKINNYDIPFCFPDLSKVRNKATIGIHADVHVIKKGNQCECFIYPMQTLENNDLNTVSSIISNTDSITTSTTMSNKNFNNVTNNVTNNISNYRYDSNNYDNSNSEFVYDNESYNNTSYVSTNNNVNYLEKDNFIENSMLSNISEQNLSSKVGLDYSRLKDINIKNVDEEKQKLEEDNAMIEVNIKDYSDIKTEIETLKRKIKEYQSMVHSLKRDLNKAKYSNPDPEIAPEVIHNLKRLNSRVSDDFMRAKYPTFNI
jgi:hypothetical protein